MAREILVIILSGNDLMSDQDIIWTNHQWDLIVFYVGNFTGNALDIYLSYVFWKYLFEITVTLPWADELKQ